MLAQAEPERILRVLESRAAFLRCLSMEPMEKRELHAELDVSRSTVDRGLRELLDLGLVEYVSNEGYKSTLCGRLLAEEYFDVKVRIAALSDVQPLLGELPADCELDSSMVSSARVVVSNTVASHLPETYLSEQVKQAERLRGLALTHSYHGAMDLFTEQVLEEGMNTEVVMQADLKDHLLESTPEKFRRLCNSDRYDIYVIDSLPYGLFLLGEGPALTAHLTVYDSNYRLVGVISNESPDAIAWCEQVYERFQTRAEPFETA